MGTIQTISHLFLLALSKKILISLKFVSWTRWKTCIIYHRHVLFHPNFLGLVLNMLFNSIWTFLATFPGKTDCQFVLMGISCSLLDMHGLLLKLLHTPFIIGHIHGPLQTPQYNLGRPIVGPWDTNHKTCDYLYWFVYWYIKYSFLLWNLLNNPPFQQPILGCSYLEPAFNQCKSFTHTRTHTPFPILFIIGFYHKRNAHYIAIKLWEFKTRSYDYLIILISHIPLTWI